MSLLCVGSLAISSFLVPNPLPLVLLQKDDNPNPQKLMDNLVSTIMKESLDVDKDGLVTKAEIHATLHLEL